MYCSEGETCFRKRVTDDILYSELRKKTQWGDRMSSAGAPLPDFQLPYTSYAPGGQNGRVNLGAQPSATGTSVPDSAGFSYPKQTEVSFAGDMLRGNWDHTALSDAFFTRRNASIIQAAIKKEVYRMSGPKKYVIDDQDVDELKMIMRAMYLQYAKNNTFNIEGQIQELNDLVIKWAAPRITSEIEHYQYYLDDISHLPVPLPQPMHMSSAGTKSLPFQPQM
jgi:hypothetical protein